MIKYINHINYYLLIISIAGNLLSTASNPDWEVVNPTNEEIENADWAAVSKEPEKPKLFIDPDGISYCEFNISDNTTADEAKALKIETRTASGSEPSDRTTKEEVDHFRSIANKLLKQKGEKFFEIFSESANIAKIFNQIYSLIGRNYNSVLAKSETDFFIETLKPNIKEKDRSFVIFFLNCLSISRLNRAKGLVILMNLIAENKLKFRNKKDIEIFFNEIKNFLKPLSELNGKNNETKRFEFVKSFDFSKIVQLFDFSKVNYEDLYFELMTKNVYTFINPPIIKFMHTSETISKKALVKIIQKIEFEMEINDKNPGKQITNLLSDAIKFAKKLLDLDSQVKDIKTTEVKTKTEQQIQPIAKVKSQKLPLTPGFISSSSGDFNFAEKVNPSKSRGKPNKRTRNRRNKQETTQGAENAETRCNNNDPSNPFGFCSCCPATVSPRECLDRSAPVEPIQKPNTEEPFFIDTTTIISPNPNANPLNGEHKNRLVSLIQQALEQTQTK